MIQEKCASCWSFSHMCITMHGSENVSGCFLHRSSLVSTDEHGGFGLKILGDSLFFVQLAVIFF
jgi:hypothetical protein